MFVIRMMKQEDMAQAVKLSDDTFRDAEQSSMGTAFPYIFAESVNHMSYGAFADGRLVSFMGLVSWTIRIGASSRLRVFSLGSVCTHPDFRKQGLASNILEKVLKFVKEAGGSLLLVSGYRSLYERAGCLTFGQFRRYTVDTAAAEALEGHLAGWGVRVRDALRSDYFTMSELANARTTSFELSSESLASLVKAEPMTSCMKLKHKVLVAEYNGTLQGFVVVGVSSDPARNGLVVESAGTQAVVAGLFGSAVREYGLCGLDIPVGWHEKELNGLLAALPYNEEDNLGTVCVIDPPAFIAQLHPWLRTINREKADQISLEENGDGQWLLRVGTDGEALELTSRQLATLIFGSTTDHEGKVSVFGDAAEMFPVPFPYSGGLCYT
jgi:predicted N-acetyltransferase YhbS